jgi:bifunctional DNase/RNase
MSENFENHGDDHLDEPPSFFPNEEFSMRSENLTEPVEVQIEGIYLTEIDNHAHQFISLTDGEEKLMISIGSPEAKAILDSLEQEVPDRPMTHDLVRVIIDRMGGTVERIVIDDLWHDIYYAKIYILQGKNEIEIDSRPSDAIAVAVRFQAPIFVQSRVFQMAHRE